MTTLLPGNLAAVIFCSAVISLHAQVTTKSLLQEMYDLKGLAEYPDPAFTTLQFSSYDRHSISPDHPDWFANSDGFGRESIPGFEEVLEEPGDDGVGRYLVCDVRGPGALVRMWTAWITGDFEVYLDGRDEPLYDGPARDFIYNAYDAIAGTEGKYNKEGCFLQNAASYYPIPFREGFKVIYEGKIDELHFYHLQVRSYPVGTDVRSFSPNDLKDHDLLITDVMHLNDPYMHEAWYDSGTHKSDTIYPGLEKSIFKLDHGNHAIRFLKIKAIAPDISPALRQNILKIYFDGASSAQVQAPIGDFFGAAPGINPYYSLPLRVEPDGSMTSYFYMPFRDSVDIRIENLGAQQISLEFTIMIVPYEWTVKSMYFRAKWRIDHGMFASYRPSQDIPYLFANGQGVMVGAAAYIYNPTSVPSSWGNWWGEGDEKIYIDKETFPSFFGTGSEDYYNYAWSSSAIFTYPYCGQPRNDGPANRGFVTNYRWHMLDKIPFNTGLAFYMELMSHEPVENFSYGRMIYLYGKPGMYDDHLSVTKEDVRTLELPANWHPLGRKGSEGAVFLQAEEIVGKPEIYSFEKDRIWSGDSILSWNPGDSENAFIINIEVIEEGEYTLVFTMGSDAEGGQFSFFYDSRAIELQGNTIVDLYDPHRVLSRNFRSVPLELKKGNNEFIVKPAEENRGKLKLDFIWVMKR